jgi:hypothetical protein
MQNLLNKGIESNFNRLIYEINFQFITIEIIIKEEQIMDDKFLYDHIKNAIKERKKLPNHSD